MTPKEKTGQSADSLKTILLSPVLAKSVLESLQRRNDLWLADFGTGDASSFLHTLDKLRAQGVHAKNVALVDTDTDIFPDIIFNSARKFPNNTTVQIVEAGQRELMEQFVSLNLDKFDAVNSQLALHQIENDSEMSLLMYYAFELLKSGGQFVLTDLHPAYIKYLADKEPNKFNVISRDQGWLVGNYNFDNGGSAIVHNRGVKNQLAVLLSLGFDFVKATPIYLTPEVADCERDRRLIQDRIPMFYSLCVRKNSAKFVSSSQGAVAEINQTGNQWVSVKFNDDEVITVPKFSWWGEVKAGSHLIVQDVQIDEKRTHILNVWAVDKDNHTKGSSIKTKIIQ